MVSDTDPGRFLPIAVGSDVPAEVLADMDGSTRNGHFLSGSRMRDSDGATQAALTCNSLLKRANCATSKSVSEGTGVVTRRLD